MDKLLRSNEIALAIPVIEDPVDPLRYDPIAAIGIAREDIEIPQRVDATAIERLGKSPGAYAVFGREKYGAWTRLALVDGDLIPIFDHIIARLEDWRGGNDADRLAYFGAMLGHSDIRVHRLALRELDRVDYKTLKGLELTIPAASITSQWVALSDPTLLPIQILLLGLSDGREAERPLKVGLKVYSNKSGPALGAFATAFLEHGGPEAAFELAMGYLADETLPLENKELVAEALAIHSQSGEEEMQNVVRGAVATVLQNEPSIAAVVARQFGAREEWSQAKLLANLLKAGHLTSPEDVIAVREYMSLAGEARAVAIQ
ncbi:hypothetical protein [Ruegeria sp. HKCCD4332]|uniref:hypothetical protein n=1 Tax=Ruegeria sp. HKCCD4332 TaxID=2683021 RepID=UPI001492C13D|nr:hypothetical protein [Ruegeria sp. HKCCD4332]NOD76200.1 hypothetical protein [Ruegeria sp. HKCCD4332]